MTYTSLLKKTMLACMLTLLFHSPIAKAQTEVPSNYGAKGALSDQTITLREALTYAIQDEYLAQSRYDAIINKFGAIQPFTRIKFAELRHIQALQRLFQKYNVGIPVNDAKNYTRTPSTLKEAYQAGVDGEIANIAMYEKFISTPALPEDVKRVMTNLRDASKNHLGAFKAGLNRLQ